MQNETLAAALAYASKLPGSLLPVESNGKRPALKGWPEKATRDPNQLEAWFAGAGYNLGWQPDECTMVLDVDSKADDQGRTGFDTLAALVERWGDLPATLTQATPTGGEHRLFRLPAGVQAKNLVGSKSGWPGLDVRTRGGQIVVQPSVRPEGVYRWQGWDPLTDDAPIISNAPAWLERFARGELPPLNAVAQKAPAKVGNADGMVREGGRNGVLVSEAAALRRKGWGKSAIAEALHALNQNQFKPPCPDNEVENVAEWVCKKYEPTASADIAQTRGADAWANDINVVDGNPTAAVEVARRVVSDASLSATETEALLKRAARCAGVALSTLRRDLSHPNEGDGRPTIQVRRGDFAASVDGCIAVLGQVAGLRQRGGKLVEVIGDVIQEVIPARLAYLTAQAARWSYGDGPGSPDPAVLQGVLAAGNWPGVPVLKGLLRAPMLLPDGTIVAQPGHQAVSGMEAIFDPRDFPAWDGNGAEALAELRGLLTGFPFVSPTDEAAALAAILTGACRPSLPTAPAFLVTAGDLGSGKTYLARIACAFAGGASPQGWPRRTEEQDKLLFAVLREAPGAWLLDNLKAGSGWSNEHLAAALTAGPSYGGRVLGVSGTEVVPTQTLLVATGNGLRPGADMTRRCITIRLDAKCERPWAREFTSDPLAMVEAAPGKWRMIALAVVSDFLKLGAKVQLPPLVSFGEWSRIVRGALVHYSMPDPVATIRDAVDHDEDRDLLDRLLSAWIECFGTEGVTARRAVEWAAWGNGAGALPLRYALEEIAQERGAVNLRVLGAWLKSVAGRIVEGRRLVNAGKARDGALWTVEQVSAGVAP